MTTPFIPLYPSDSPALIRLLLAREKARLLGPVTTYALVNDRTLGREVEAAMEKALEQLESAEQWVGRCAAFEGY